MRRVNSADCWAAMEAGRTPKQPRDAGATVFLPLGVRCSSLYRKVTKVSLKPLNNHLKLN